MNIVFGLLAVSLLGLMACQKNPCDHGTIEEQVQCLRRLPKENSPAFLEMRKNSRIFYSITTSPKRLPLLHYTLDTLDLSVPEKVFIAIPELYKDKEPYEPAEIEKLKQYSAKIEILRPKRDLGPIMKLLPAAEEVQKLPADTLRHILVTFDDDIGYPAGLPEQLLLLVAKYPDAAVSGAGADGSAFGIKDFPHSRSACQHSGISHCDMVEGWQGIAYPVERIRIGLMQEMARKPGCRGSDDLTISYVLAVTGVQRLKVHNQYTANLLPFKHGEESADALHLQSDNEYKYRKCFEKLSI